MKYSVFILLWICHHYDNTWSETQGVRSFNDANMIALYVGLRNDRGRASAFNVLSICEGTFGGQIRCVRDSRKKCRYEDHWTWDRRLTSQESSGWNLHQRQPDHERYHPKLLSFTNTNTKSIVKIGSHIWHINCK